jgi:hypothetical protein
MEKERMEVGNSRKKLGRIFSMRKVRKIQCNNDSV